MTIVHASPRRVFLEMVPTPSPLAAADPAADLAGNLDAAMAVESVGVVVDREWRGGTLGGSREAGGPLAALAGRPRFDRIMERVNRAGERVSGALPGRVPAPTLGTPPRTVLFRAELAEGSDPEQLLSVAAEHRRLRVFADPPVVLAQRKPSDPAHGTASDVADRLGASKLHDHGLTGEGVPVVLVDAGVNFDFLRTLAGRRHAFDDAFNCAAPEARHAPGRFPPGHGTMAAFQVGIAAPAATIVDHAVIVPGKDAGDGPVFDAWLSDIAPGYQLLFDYLNDQEAVRPLVVSNSWALLDPAWDFPPGSNECFADNPDHPFNRLVCDIVRLGADVLFAAGNCGQPHPVSGCGFDSQPIRGANSLEEVITVGAVDIDGERVGYSSQGPGLLAFEKPDLCGYSHYEGSGINGPDWGTSAACPGVAGVVAAVRTRHSPEVLPPADLKRLLNHSAHRAEGAGHDPDVGFGVVDAAALLEALPE
jgi:subtilisin family serine protease